MTVTQFGWCDHCDDRVELVPEYVDPEFGNILVCYRCGR